MALNQDPAPPVQSTVAFRRDLFLYCLAAGLTALIGVSDIHDWKSWASIALAVVIAAKGKLSPGKTGQ